MVSWEFGTSPMSTPDFFRSRLDAMIDVRVRHVSPSAGRKSAKVVDGKALSCLVTFNSRKVGS
jgi:hypothetical protein